MTKASFLTLTVGTIMTVIDPRLAIAAGSRVACVADAHRDYEEQWRAGCRRINDEPSHRGMLLSKCKLPQSSATFFDRRLEDREKECERLFSEGQSSTDSSPDREPIYAPPTGANAPSFPRFSRYEVNECTCAAADSIDAKRLGRTILTSS
jgi:hypothetical protein